MTLPHPNTLLKAAEICISQDKPIMLDYFQPSCNGACQIGKENEEKVLYKDEDEFTSPIKTVLKVDNSPASVEYLFETVNSVYVVSSQMLG
mgnify:CR=1 FL=1|tara:strand:- start:3531 stop:3803 length:273 start_codon:yes stop_codon:yes gene_type:complete